MQAKLIRRVIGVTAMAWRRVTMKQEPDTAHIVKRRAFFQRLLGGLGAAVTGPRLSAGRSSVVIQESSIAGFQFHDGDAVWSSLAVGAKLRLVREPQNPHDPDAVAVCFGEHQLGYVPRAQNSALAQMLDRDERLEARISGLTMSDEPWQRVKFTVSLA